ncbi:MAG: methyltransferase domain-containing protein, partial [Myxococcota bacterium]
MRDKNDFLERLIKDAGISSGDRVLDVGSGLGEVSLLLSQIVGETGEVIGLERNEKALIQARARVEEANLTNVRFLQVDLSASLPELPRVDAIVGRRVLMYLPDPVEALNQLVCFLRPGGIVLFEETDSTMIPASISSFPVHDKVLRWIWETVEKEGGNRHMGFTLPSVFQKARMDTKHVRAEAMLADSESLTEMLPLMKSRIIERGVATEAEVDLPSLVQKLR